MNEWNTSSSIDNVVTIDAIGCQTAITKQIREQGGDYVIALKGNQGTLHAEAVNFFQQAIEVTPIESGCDFVSMLEKNRGRIEEREVWTCSLDWLEIEQLERWTGLKSFDMYQIKSYSQGNIVII